MSPTPHTTALRRPRRSSTAPVKAIIKASTKATAATLATAAVATVLAGMMVCGNAAAQTSGLSPDAAPDAGPDAWRFSLGLGAISRPRFPGSSERRTSALPIFSASYGRFFIGGLPDSGVPVGLGATLLQSGPWRAGLGLGADFGKSRKESDSARLRGLGDVDGTVSGTAFASYDLGFVVARANVISDIGGKDHGTRVNFNVEGRYSITPQWTLVGGPGITWADSTYTRTFFGVTAAQSAASGLAQHAASSGLHSVRLGLGANYQLSPQWSLGGRVTASRLEGDAADSPITEKRMQNTLGLFANYRF